MKKIFISTVLVLSALGTVSAQSATSTEQMPPALPPVITTGSSTLDREIKALRQEMESRIKALREEYQTKLKAIIGANVALKKQGVASSTQAKKEERKDMRMETKGTSTRPDVQGTSTPGMRASPNGNAWGFFSKFFGIMKPAEKPAQ